jgi:hypothetical protein
MSVNTEATSKVWKSLMWLESQSPEASHVLKASVDKILADQTELYAYTACTPITRTYLHLPLARQVADLTELGVKMVVNILDSPMQSEEAFLRKVQQTTNTSPEAVIKSICDDFYQFVVSLGGNPDNLRIVRLSELFRTFTHEQKLVNLWYQTLGRVNFRVLEEYPNSRPYLSQVISDSLDVFFAQFVDELMPEFAKFSTTLFISGYPRSLLHRTLISQMDEFSQVKSPMFVFSIPHFPDISKPLGDRRKYMDIDFPSLRVQEFVQHWWLDNGRSDPNSSAITNQIANLYRYYFARGHKNAYFPRDGKIEDVAITESLEMLIGLKDRELFSKYEESMPQALAWNFDRCFNEVNLQMAKSRNERSNEVRVINCTTKDELDDIVKNVLSTRHKYEILLYSNGEYTQKEIAEKIGIDESTISVYLNKFRKLRIVSMDPHGKPISLVKAIQVSIPELRADDARLPSQKVKR